MALPIIAAGVAARAGAKKLAKKLVKRKNYQSSIKDKMKAGNMKKMSDTPDFSKTSLKKMRKIFGPLRAFDK